MATSNIEPHRRKYESEEKKEGDDGIAEDQSTSKETREISDTDDSSSVDDFDLQFSCEVCNKSFSGIKPLRQHEKGAKHLKNALRKKLEKDIHKKLLEEESTEPIDFDEDSFSVKEFASCKVCRKQFFGPESYNQHLSSTSHLKKVKKSKLLEQALEGKNINQEKLKAILEKRKASPQAPDCGVVRNSGESDSSDSDVKKLQCEICDKEFSSVEPWLQHINSKTHEKKKKQNKLMVELMSRDQHSVSDDVVHADPFSSVLVEDDVLTCRLCHMAFSGPESMKSHLKSRGHKKRFDLRKWKLVQKQKSLLPSKVHQKDVESFLMQLEQGTTAQETRQEDDATKQMSKFSLEDEQPSSMTKEHGEDAKRDTLLGYENYKKYKEIMNEVKSDGKI